MKTQQPIASAFSMVAVLAAACASHVRISQLLADPGYYDGKTVVTTGSVASSAGVLGYATFQLKDSGGAITVVTASSGAPRDNTRVEVKGKFHSAFTLGTKTLAVLEESRRRPIGP
jgi:hypothetical protein